MEKYTDLELLAPEPIRVKMYGAVYRFPGELSVQQSLRWQKTFNLYSKMDDASEEDSIKAADATISLLDGLLESEDPSQPMLPELTPDALNKLIGALVKAYFDLPDFLPEEEDSEEPTEAASTTRKERPSRTNTKRPARTRQSSSNSSQP